ncbi:MAG: ABC transporter permease, partial [Planctomycetota bacterium]
MAFLFEIIRLGLSNLRLHLLRSVLAALGIILGVAAVITMVSLGEGSKQQALRQIEALGARNIIIRSQPPPAAGNVVGGQTRSFINRYGITRADYEVVLENFGDVEAIVPLKEIGSQLLKEDRVRSSQTFGTTPALLE